MRAWIAGLSVLAALGIALALVGGDTLDAIGVGLVGLAAVGAVSLGFFAIGRSEDRAREAEAAAREPGAEAEAAAREPGAEAEAAAREPGAEGERPPDTRLTARRPPRSRGDS